MKYLSLVPLLAVLCAAPVQAAEEPARPATPTPAQTVKAPAPAAVSAKPAEVPGSAASAPAAASTLARGETNLTLDQTAHFTVPSLTCGANAQKMQLWLDGMDTGVRSIGCDDIAKMLTFNISRDGTAANDQTDQAWLTLLRDPFTHTDKNTFDRSVLVTLKTDNGTTLAHQATKMRLLEKSDLWLAAIVVIVAFLLLAVGMRSGMLRDSGVPQGGGDRPFSLARVQMVWWFGIVFVSYVLLWLTMHELPRIPATVLGLIGMASGTALIAAGIDKNRNDPLQPSKGFWYDITTDAHGVTLPRLQQVIWTLLFGVVFIDQMLNKLSMPEFDSSVLALMGISAGAYLGFKVPERHVDNATPAAPPAAKSDPKGGYEPV
ncbi:MAG TPA: hypothetical protein VFK88_01945 [Gallionella sp.]|nr:hypothetical protein [Gallionella sp.]